MRMNREHGINRDPFSQSGKFVTWKNLGNAGSHVGMEEVKQIDAKYFLAGLADVVGFTLDQRTESAVPSSTARSLLQEHAHQTLNFTAKP